MRDLSCTFHKLLLIILILTTLVFQSACSSLPVATSLAGQDRVLTNMMCKDRVVVRLIPKGKRWYVEIGESRYRMSKAGAALKPIMEGRKNKSVYLIVHEKVKYTVLQQFADYVRDAGVTCVNWGRSYYKLPNKGMQLTRNNVVSHLQS